MEPISIAFLTLAALITGAVLPVLFQLRATLRSAQLVLDTSGPKLAKTLAEVAVTTQEFNGIAKDVATTLDQIRGTVRTATAIGSAIGPAIVAAVNAYKTIRADDARVQAEGSGDSTGNPSGPSAN